MDTALIKLYCKGDPSKLVSLVSSQHLSCDENDCLSALRNAERHHALALLLLRMKRFEEAFGLWIRLVQNSITDDNFPGMECLIHQLVL